MDFDQRGHSIARCEYTKASHLSDIKNGGDQQDGVGSVRGGFDDMEFVDREILAQNRNGDRGAGGFEIGETPLKKLFIGENTQGRGST